MKLLIVDDQKTVVSGLQNKVQWDLIGIDQVFGCYSVAEARTVLASHDIDVMLCDIEMPLENGLTLLRWVRESDMPTRCILLTSHADFAYAQKSVSLGAFDYIVQPAPYADISGAVERAIKDIEQERSEQFRSTYGQVVQWQRSNEASQALHRYLDNGEYIGELMPYGRQGRLPNNDQPFYLIQLQILRFSSYEQWSDELLTVMLDNAVNEVFASFGQSAVIVMVREGCFALLLWSGIEPLSVESVAHQLSFLYNVCRQNLNCTVALYQRGPIMLPQLYATWTQLQGAQERESSRTGVIVSQQDRDSKRYVFVTPELEHWDELLRDQPAKLEQQAGELMAMLKTRGELSKERLSQIYEDFLQVVHRGTGQGDAFWRSVLVDLPSYEIYRAGMRSAEQFIQLVHMVVGQLDKQTPTLEEQDIVERIKAYIDEHMDREIHRSDLAAHVFLHPDYLNRLFKKKTGYTLKDFVIRYKIEHANMMLKMTRLPVNIIAAKVGYSNFSHFSYTFKKIVGLSPMETRQANASKEESP
ncbi:MAG: response regulator [Clostridiales bacterium]|nr:response regulator [Clostridiales bacterium]